MSNYLKTKNGVNLLPGATSVTDEGDLGYNSTSKKIEYKDDSAVRSAVSEDGTQTLTNKTLTGNTAVNLISGSGTLTLNTTGTITVPNATDTLVGKATTDTLTNKTLSGNTATNLISGSGTLTLNTTGTITVPNATDTLVGKNTTDTLTNKSISASQINSGTLAIAQGGTNSGTALNNNRIMQTSGSAIVEAAAITASRALASDANGIPTHSTVTTTELNYVSGATSNIQAQLNLLSPVTFIPPTIQTFTSGSGTYTTPTSPGPLYIRVRMVGGGGGGSFSGTAPGTAATDGGNTTFGSSLLTANGGVHAIFVNGPGVGGSTTINSPAIGTGVTGATGCGYGATSATTAFAGGQGGASAYYGGAGAGGNYAAAGGAGITNTGGGGGGGGQSGATSPGATGSGGGAGGFIEAIIGSPSATYSYAVGAKGNKGTANGNGFGADGGDGGSGYIEVTEYYH